MAEQRVRRRLAAILAADVVGYSRLMSENEDATLAAFKAHLGELIEPAITARDGRVFKTTGDGLLAEFASAVDAVACAQAIQDGMAARNEGLEVARAIELRIAVNVGDVIVEGDDIYGSGVNVAARLEHVAEPGGVCVSGTVYDQVRGKLGLGFDDIGAQRFKNIDEPVRAYRVLADPREAETLASEREQARARTRRRAITAALVAGVVIAFAWSIPWGDPPEPEPVPVSAAVPVPAEEAPAVVEDDGAPAVPEIPSLAVLPFAAASDDAANVRIADGFAASLAASLAGLDGLFTISPGSTLGYRDGAVPVAEIARELGVAHVVEGRIEAGTQRFSVTARLIEAASGNVVTTVTRNGALSEALKLRALLAREIAAALGVEPSPAEEGALDRVPAQSVAAWDLYLQGRALVADLSGRDGDEHLDEARGLFRAAIARDPGFADAYAGLSATHSRAVDLGLSEAPADDLARAADFASTALAIDTSSIEGLLALANTRLAGGRMDEAISLYRSALDVAPGNAEAHARIALALAFSGQGEEAAGHALRAVRLDPRDRSGRYRNAVAFTHFAAGHYAEALAAWQAVEDLASQAPGITALAAAAHTALGEDEMAAAARERVLAAEPDFTISGFALLRPFAPAERERIAELLRSAGLPE